MVLPCMKKYIGKLAKVLRDNNVCSSHGISHAIAVLSHAEKILETWNFKSGGNIDDTRENKETKKCEHEQIYLTYKQKFAILLAALLHDADDTKFFPSHVGTSAFDNLEMICVGNIDVSNIEDDRITSCKNVMMDNVDSKSLMGRNIDGKSLMTYNVDDKSLSDRNIYIGNLLDKTDKSMSENVNRKDDNNKIMDDGKDDGKDHDCKDDCISKSSLDKENKNDVTIDKETLTLIKQMVGLVSSSKNGDTISQEIIRDKKEWMLIPRYADRLEALGKVGIERCWQYTKTIGRPLFTSLTLLPKDEKELWESVATIERYNTYRGNSISMIDHYYDKLLRLSFFAMKNKSSYIDEECVKRRKILVDFILFCCDRIRTNGQLTDDDVLEMLKSIN